jgi:hypothetical protein
VAGVGSGLELTVWSASKIAFAVLLALTAAGLGIAIARMEQSDVVSVLLFVFAIFVLPGWLLGRYLDRGYSFRRALTIEINPRALVIVGAVALFAVVSAAYELTRFRFEPAAFDDVYEDQSAAGVREALGEPDYELVRPPDTPVWIWTDDRTACYVFFFDNPKHIPTGVDNKEKHGCTGPHWLSADDRRNFPIC